MASALMDGLISNNVITNPSSIICSDVWEPARISAKGKGYTTSESNVEVCSKAKDAVILAVKPNVIADVCKDIPPPSSESADEDAVVISIAAGVTLTTLEQCMPGRRIIRVMPNTPCLVGESATGYALGTHATAADKQILETIFGSVGIAIEVKESLLDAVTGLSGSGPAYVYQFIEALSDGGVRAGLPRNIATELAAQTVKGAAEMVLKTGKHPGLLKDGVTSPGGTTIAGVEALENGGFRATTISAVKAATKRSMQLGGVPQEEIEHKHNL